MDLFQSTPTEIVAHIFTNLSTADLVNTSYLSHRLRAISQPLLYSSLSLYSFVAGGNRPPTPLENILRTLLTPGGEVLGTCVNALTLQWGCRVYLDSESDYPHRFLNDSATLGPAPSTSALRRLSPNSQVLLLLSRLPRLRVFDVMQHHATGVSFNSFVAEFMTTLGATPLPSAFHSLRKVRYGSDGATSGINHASLLVLLQLPCIDTLELVLYLPETIPSTYGVGCSSTVTKLSLWAHEIIADELTWILRIPRRLTHFSCIPPTNLPFGDALQPLQDSLEHLALYPAGPHEDFPAIGSLREWAALRSVCCTIEHLSGRRPEADWADVLPPGIRTLEIVHGAQLVPEKEERLRWVVSAAVSLLQRKCEVVPRLEMLVVDMDPGVERERLLEACVVAGVSFWSYATVEGGCCYNVAS